MLTNKNTTGYSSLASAKSEAEVDSSIIQGVDNTPTLLRVFCVFFYVPTMTGGFRKAFACRFLVCGLSIRFSPVTHKLIVMLTGFLIYKGTTMPALQILNTEIRTLDNLYSLNDLHKTSGADKKHQPSFFMRNEQTKDLINEIEQSAYLQSATKSVNGGINRGTYACKEIVYAYAMWISPKFNLQVIRSFDQMQSELLGKAEQLPEQPQTLTSEQCLHIRERVGEMVHAFKDTSWQIQYGKINRHFNKNSYKDILASDYPKVCQFLNCRPKPELVAVELPDNNLQLPTAQTSPFLNERILFEWENGVLVRSRPMAENEITTTKERILKLVTYHDFTTFEERLELTQVLNADLAKYSNELNKALIRERKTRRENMANLKH